MSDIDLKQSLLSDASEFDSVPRPPHIKALKRVNIDIKRGKLTIILGDIGSGKSSLLYSIVGEMKP
jgi:ABC-type lipoprotein export system ATPase subunit